MISSYRTALFLFASLLLTGCLSDSSEPDNIPPEIQLLVEKTEYQEGEVISLAALASDKDGDDFQVSWLLVDAPSQVTLEKLSDYEVRLVLTAPLEQGALVTVQVNVSDGSSEVSLQTQISITQNLAPQISYDADAYSFQLGEDLSFPVTITDSDSDDLYTLWELTDSPEGYDISSRDGVAQLTAPAHIEESVGLTALLQVSDGYNAVEKEFAITLLPKDIVEVTLVYPPASAITDARSTVIRGSSSFELSSLMVNGEAVTSSDNFLNWTVTLPIAELETLAITPETSVLPTQTLEYKNFERTIKHAKPFMLENESLTAFGDHVYLINDSSKQIIQHNLVTNERSIIFQATADFDFEPEQAIVDKASNRLVIAGTLETAVETYGLTVVALDLASFTTTVLFQDLRYEAFNSIAFNGDNNKLLIPDWHSDGKIFEIDLTTGIKTQLYAAKSDFGIEVDRGYELQYRNGDLLWGDVGTPKLYKIDQVNDQMSIIWQGSDYQAEMDSLDLSLRFYQDFIYDEEANKLTLILYEGAIIFDLNLQIVESFADFRNLISPFEEVESAHVSGRDVHIWDEGVQMLITYNLDSGAYVASGNDSVNINLSRYPRSIALSSDEKSLYYSSDESPAMYRFPIDATDNSQLETVFDLSVNNDTDGQPNFYFEQYVTVNPVESGFYLTKDYDAGGLYFFEFDTQDIINIAFIEDLQSEFAIDVDRNLAFTLTENTYHDGENWIDEIFWKKINLDSGEATDFSSNLDYIGTEFEYERIDSLTLRPDGEALIVEMDDNLVQISTSDGGLTWFSKDNLMPNLSSNSIESFVWAGDELIAINGNANSGIYKVDQSTGEYTELSGKFVGSGATPFDFDTGVYSGALQQFFIVDYDLEAIYAIDELTGERLIIHK